jgi:hypothetical protein
MHCSLHLSFFLVIRLSTQVRCVPVCVSVCAYVCTCVLSLSLSLSLALSLSLSLSLLSAWCLCVCMGVRGSFHQLSHLETTLEICAGVTCIVNAPALWGDDFLPSSPSLPAGAVGPADLDGRRAENGAESQRPGGCWNREEWGEGRPFCQSFALRTPCGGTQCPAHAESALRASTPHAGGHLESQTILETKEKQCCKCMLFIFQ